MVKVKALKTYNDLILKKIIEKNVEFEVEQERAAKLEKEGMVKLIKVSKTKEA